MLSSIKQAIRIIEQVGINMQILEYNILNLWEIERERKRENILNLYIGQFSTKHQENEPVAKGLWNSNSGKRVIWAYDIRVLLDVMRCSSSSAIFERFVYSVVLVIQ